MARSQDNFDIFSARLSPTMAALAMKLGITSESWKKLPFESNGFSFFVIRFRWSRNHILYINVI